MKTIADIKQHLVAARMGVGDLIDQKAITEFSELHKIMKLLTELQEIMNMIKERESEEK
jgi:hypothetical protein